MHLFNLSQNTAVSIIIKKNIFYVFLTKTIENNPCYEEASRVLHVRGINYQLILHSRIVYVL